jgi:hypothetical protein
VLDISDRLRSLARQRESITILYHGGSQPGTKREIFPISVTGKRVRARELANDEVKTFSLDKIEIVAEDYAAKDYVSREKVDNQVRNLLDVLKNEVQELEQLGWEVMRTEDAIKLYNRSKTGKITRHATVGLRRNYDQVLTITLDGGSNSSREHSSDRPWYVFGPDFLDALVEPEPEAGQTYKYLSKAVRVFLEQARRHAPCSKKETRRRK